MAISPLLYFALGFLPCVLGQVISNAQCTLNAYGWTFNSAGESPCLVTAQLGAVCNGGRYTISALPEGTSYLGPTPEAQNSCRCNSVYYSLLSACAACQGRHWLDWSQYITNCTTVYLTMFPQPLPLKSRVPAWAYGNVSETDAFSLIVAHSLEGAPESTLPIATVGSTLFTLPTSPSTSSNPNPTELSSNDSSSSKPNAGAIAGGVIGGIVGLAIIAVLAFFLLRRRKRTSQKLASSEYSTTPYSGTPFLSDQMSYGSYAPVTTLKPYDPSDPSTYPTTSTLDDTTTSPLPHANGSPFYDSSNPSAQRPNQLPSPVNGPTGHYTGVPEI